MPALALCDRAFALVAARGSVAEDELLAHVYGGATPVALHARLAAPLLGDPRLERHADGTWRLRTAETDTADGFVALAVVATGPTPGRARLARLSALRVASAAKGEAVSERFDVTLDPGVRVPRYVLDRLGVDQDALTGQPTFVEVADDLERFVGTRAVLAQDAELSWAFVVAEARRLERVLPEPRLVDFNALASERLALKGKPTLGLVAAQLGIGTVHVTRADEEARLLATIGRRLLVDGARDRSSQPVATLLRRGDTARALPDEPGVYVLRDADQMPLYVGKARRLRSRMTAYVRRPLGATRRLEGLVGAADALDTTRTQTDLEALVLEDREIRRLQPRFNTVRQQRAPRVWIRRPQQRVNAKGRMLAPPRLELSDGPRVEAGEFIGPFRNESAADQARQLARDVFELDAARRDDPLDYPRRLDQAWALLHGDTSVAEAIARQRSTPLLRRVLTFDARANLLPADPAEARYAILRPNAAGIEGLLVDRAVLYGWARLDEDVHTFALALLEQTSPRTAPEDATVVLRWFGAQRPTARLVWLPDDALAAADAIEAAALDLVAWET